MLLKVWTLRFSPGTTAVGKDPARAGMLSDDIGQGMRTREMVKDILKCIREGVIPAEGVRKELWEALPPPERNPACSVAVKDWRKARTVTTLSWRDGLHAGTIVFITIAQDGHVCGSL